MQSGRAFLKNTIWYLIPFLIMTVVSIISLNYIFHILQEQNQEIVSNQLKHLSDEIEEDLFVSRQLALEISMDTTLTNVEMLKYELVTIDGIEKLAYYKQRMEICSSLFIAYKPDKLITSIGSTSETAFWNIEYNLLEDETQLVTQLMADRKDYNCVLQKKNGKKIILLLYYFPGNRYIGERWVGFVVEGDYLVKQVNKILGDLDCAYVINFEEKVIDEINKLYNHETQENLDDLFAKLIKGEKEIPGYTVLTEQCETLYLLIHIALSNHTYMREIISTQVKVFGVALISFVGLCIFLWFYGRYQYKKALAVHLMAVNMYPELSANNECGEYEFIQSVLEKDFERLRYHDEMLEYFRDESKKQLSWMLLKSTLPEEVQLEELMENSGIEITGSYYVVLEFLLSTVDLKFDFLDNIFQVLLSRIESNEAGNILIVVLSLDSRDANHMLRFTIAKQITEELAKHGSACEGISSGLVYETLNEIHSSQEEAYSLLNVLSGTKSKEKHRIVFFDEAAQMTKKVPHKTADLLQKFKEFLLEGNREGAISIFDILVEHNKENSHELMTYVHYKIIQIIANEWKLKENSPEMVDNFLLLINYEGDLFKKEAKKCIDLLCINEGTPNVDINDILTFINKHAWDSQLSMNMITDNMNISERSVRRIMKEKIGKTYKEYITDIRMEKACELLKNTKLDIQTIVMQVGYFNVPSFNRLFKLKYGLSPGEYRMEDSRDIK